MIVSLPTLIDTFPACGEGRRSISTAGGLTGPMIDPRSRILIVKISSMGDILHALPALCALRSRFPEAHLSWLVDERFTELLNGHPALDEVIPARAPRWVNRVRIRQDIARGAAHFQSILHLRQREFDLAIDLQGLLRSALLARASGAARILGFASAREGAPLLYTDRIDVRGHRHVVRQNLALIEPLTGPIDRVEFGLHIDVDAQRTADRVLTERGIAPTSPYLLIAPKSSRREKDWPVDRWGELVDHVWNRHALPSVLVGGGSEAKACGAIAGRSAGVVATVLSQPLSVVAAMMKRSLLMIGPDSGPVHLAAALGRPVVAIFGPTPPERLAPWGFENWVVHQTADCPACQRKSRRRWTREPHRCLSQLSVGVVAEHVDRILGRLRQAA